MAIHALNMTNKVGCQRTYGALTNGNHLMLFCYDAGDAFASWDGKSLKTLQGRFTHSRCAACIIFHGWPKVVDVMPVTVMPTQH